jgi:hypothetical protein
MEAGLCQSGGATWRRRRSLEVTAAGGGEDRTVVAEGRGTLLQLEGGGNKRGGQAPTARRAKLTGEGEATSPRQFPTRGSRIQRRKADTWPRRSEGEGDGASGRLDPRGGRESRKGGFCTEAEGKRGRGPGTSTREEGEGEEGSGAARRRVERWRCGGGGLVAGTTRDRWRRAPVGDM